MIFFGFGAAFFVMMVREFVKGWSMQHWPTTNCTIVASAAEPEGNGYAFKVRYHYEFAGKSHIGTVYRNGYKSSDDYPSADKAAKKFAVGTNHTCHVNPANADEAVLDVQTGWMWLAMLWLPLLFMVIGGGGTYFVWFGRDKNKALSDLGKPISDRATRTGTRIGGALLGLAFIGGTIASVLWAFPTMQKFAASKNWPATPCKVISSRVQSHHGDDSTTYSVDILYAYTVNGQEFKSSRYDFIGGSSSGFDGKRQIVSHYPPGKTATCYVNPSDPSDAVLSPGWSPKALLLILPIAFMLGGGGGLIGMYRASRRKQSGENIWALKRAATGTTVTSASIPQISHHVSTAPTTATLKPTQTARAKFLGLLIFTAIWDGGLAIFFYIWRSNGGKFELCGGLFASIFFLVGIILIGGLIYSFLALANPNAVMELAPSVLTLGSSAVIRWKLNGRTDRISRLTIRIEGREEATYRRGTRTYTDRNVFQIIQLVDTTSAIEISRGEARFHVPENTMHSFEAGNNKIVWEIKLRGEIAKWPDVITEYPVQISPLEVRA